MLPDRSIRARPAGSTDGAVVRLPAAYVAEHVELGYAASNARTEGITVDETHTIATPGMAREDLYVAMSRGRALNRTYIALEQPGAYCLPDRAQPPMTAREVLDQILATTHAELTATETWTALHPQTRHTPRRRLPGPSLGTQPDCPHLARRSAALDPAGTAPVIGL